MPNITTSLITVFVVLISLIPLSAATSEYEEEVYVYNWHVLIPKGVLEDFTKETGINVKYFTYKNDEIMYLKLKLLRGKGYDVVIPSTSVVSKLWKEGLIQNIDKDKIIHFKELNPNVLNKSYDPNNEFSIPLVKKSIGIAINTEKIKAEKILSWEDLWAETWKEKIIYLDHRRTMFSIALKVLGYSPNTNEPEKIKQAFEKLNTLIPNIKKVGNDNYEQLEKGDFDIAIAWSPDIVRINNSKVKYILPQEGALFRMDSFSIPAKAPNLENAYKFINYLSQADIAMRYVKELGFTTPNLIAKGLLEEKIRNNKNIFIPIELNKKVEFNIDINQKTKYLYRLYWDKLKSNYKEYKNK